MTESRSERDANKTYLAREIFERVNNHLDNEFVPSTVTSATDGLSNEGGASTENEDTLQQHLISSVTFRCIEGDDGELDNDRDNDGESENDGDNERMIGIMIKLSL